MQSTIKAGWTKIYKFITCQLKDSQTSRTVHATPRTVFDSRCDEMMMRMALHLFNNCSFNGGHNTMNNITCQLLSFLYSGSMRRVCFCGACIAHTYTSTLTHTGNGRTLRGTTHICTAHLCVCVCVVRTGNADAHTKTKLGNWVCKRRLFPIFHAIPYEHLIHI